MDNRASKNNTPKDYLDTLDHSVLQVPLNIGVKNVQQIINALQSGNNEVKGVLINECNIIYECKICNNLFRCFANLLAHKRFYCKEKSKIETSIATRVGETVILQPTSPDVQSRPASEGSPDEEEPDGNERAVKIQTSAPRIFDGSRSSEKKKFTRETVSPPEYPPKDGVTVIQLERIDGNSNAVFQTWTSKARPPGSIRPCAVQLDKVVSVPVPIENKKIVKRNRNDRLSKRTDCNIDKLTCLHCQTKYNSALTLYRHMVNLHAPNKSRYPCPYCKTTFVQNYGVIKHLVSVHKKTKEQAFRIRSSHRKNLTTQKAKAQKKIDIPKPIIPSPSNRKQTWFNCSNCPRKFTRRVSQISHQKFCTLKNVAFKEPMKRVLIKQTARKSVTTANKCNLCGRYYPQNSNSCRCTVKSNRSPQYKRSQRRKSTPSRIQQIRTSPIKSPPIRSKASKPGTSTVVLKTLKPVVNASLLRPRRITGRRPDKDFVDSQSLKWRSANRVESVGSSPNTNQKKVATVEPLPVPMRIEKKILSCINLKKMICLKCHRKFSSTSNLRRHVATHIGWNRYQCNHCPFLSFNRSDCRLHIQKNHPADAQNAETLIVSIHTITEKASSEDNGRLLEDNSHVSENKSRYSKQSSPASNPPPLHQFSSRITPPNQTYSRRNMSSRKSPPVLHPISPQTTESVDIKNEIDDDPILIDSSEYDTWPELQNSLEEYSSPSKNLSSFKEDFQFPRSASSSSSQNTLNSSKLAKFTTNPIIITTSYKRGAVFSGEDLDVAKKNNLSKISENILKKALENEKLQSEQLEEPSELISENQGTKRKYENEDEEEIEEEEIDQDDSIENLDRITGTGTETVADIKEEQVLWRSSTLMCKEDIPTSATTLVTKGGAYQNKPGNLELDTIEKSLPNP